MFTATASSGPVWLVAVIPITTVILAALAAYAAFYPQWKDRKAREQKRVEHEDRLTATADAVLGRDANTDFHGQPKVVGLVELFTETQKELARIAKTLGTNGSGKTVMEHLAQNTADIGKVGAGQTILSEHLEDHMDSDTRKFDQLSRAIAGLQSSVQNRRPS